MVPLKEAMVNMVLGIRKEQEILEKKLDRAIQGSSEDGYSGFTKFGFHCSVLSRSEIKEVLNRYEKEGYKTKLHSFGGSDYDIRISMDWS